MSKPFLNVELDEGTYQYILDHNGRSQILRHGQPWKKSNDSDLLHSLTSTIIELVRAKVARLEGGI